MIILNIFKPSKYTSYDPAKKSNWEKLRPEIMTHDFWGMKLSLNNPNLYIISAVIEYWMGVLRTCGDYFIPNAYWYNVD